MLQSHLAASPAATARFRDASLLAAEVSHPNIATVLDFEEPRAARPYLVMEHVNGGSVADRLRQDSAPLVPEIMQELTAALGELHARGIAHGAVNSRNLLLQRNSMGTERVKLVDFGRAYRFKRLAEPPMSATADLDAAAAVEDDLRHASAGAPLTNRSTLSAAPPVVQPAPAARVTRATWLRGRVGRALRCGDMDRAAELYLGLAVLLGDLDDRCGAEAELVEAVNVLTRGAGPTAMVGPDSLWRILLLLGELQAGRGARAEARTSSAHAYQHADRVRSIVGRSRAESLARRARR
jgi:hypothetical protein